MGCGGYRLVYWVQRVEVSGGVDNDHAQESRDNPMHLGSTLYSTLVCLDGVGTLEWNSALFLSVECSNIQTLNHATKNIKTLRILKVLVKSLYAYNYNPRYGKISQKLVLIFCISALAFFCTIYSFIILFAVLFCTYCHNGRI